MLTRASACLRVMRTAVSACVRVMRTQVSARARVMRAEVSARVSPAAQPLRTATVRERVNPNTPARAALLFLVASLAASLAMPAQFNHKAALEQKIECLTCHTAQRESISLSEKHKSKILKDFNHAFHLKMGNIAPILRAAIESKKYLASPSKVDIPALRAHLDTRNPCQACHRGLETSTGALTKANFPHMEDCLVCHNKIDNPFTCTKCHLESMNLRPANHSPDFLDRHTTGKLNLDKTTCASCHGQRFTCLGCH